MRAQHDQRLRCASRAFLPFSAAPGYRGETEGNIQCPAPNHLEDAIGAHQSTLWKPEPRVAEEWQRRRNCATFSFLSKSSVLRRDVHDRAVLEIRQEHD